MIKYILTDLEGTTTSISFVHDVLFPYSSRQLLNFLRKNSDKEEVKSAIAMASLTLMQESENGVTSEQTEIALLSWIQEDRKHPALKNLQGLIWKDGYEQGEFTGHIYDDVRPALESWKDRGLQLGIYSSGSEEAQRLLMKYSDMGDMTPLFSNFFDTRVGNKREPDSYNQIAKELGINAGEILFLTDVLQEVEAAMNAGIQVIQLHRPDNAQYIQAKKCKNSSRFL